MLCERSLLNERVIAVLYEPCLLETQEHVVVLILHETAPKTTYVKFMNACGHVLGDNTWKGRVVLHAFIAVFVPHWLLYEFISATRVLLQSYWHYRFGSVQAHKLFFLP